MAEAKKRIRILYTIPNFDTAGSGKALLNVALGLNPNVFEVYIVCSHNRGDFFKVVKSSGISVYVFNYTCTMKPYLKGLWTCFKISKKFKALKPDIVHSFHYAADYSEPLAVRLAGVKWIYTKKNMNWGGASKNSWKLRTLLANKVVAQNEDMLSNFFSKLKKVTLIPRGVNTIVFQPLKPDVKLRLLWNLKDTDRILCCVANLSPIKGIDILLKAFKNVYLNHLEWKLILVGDTSSSYGKDMIQLSKDLGIYEEVRFCGKQFDVVDYINLSEVVVLPTLDKGEGSPVSLLEAMACQKNVLASNVSGIKDQLSKFPEHLVQPGDVGPWSKALEHVLSNSVQVNIEQGQILREHVLNCYTIEREVTLCESMYLNLLNSNI